MKALMVTTSSSDAQTSNNNQTQTTADTNNTASQQTTTASQGADTQSSDDSLSNAQGLSLSTAPKTTTKKKTSSEKSVGTWILILTVSMTFSGLVLLGVAATIVYYYRKTGINGVVIRMNMMRFTTMKTKLRKYPSIFLILLLAISSCFLTGCVNQHPKDSKRAVRERAWKLCLRSQIQRKTSSVKCKGESQSIVRQSKDRRNISGCCRYL